MHAGLVRSQRRARARAASGRGRGACGKPTRNARRHSRVCGEDVDPNEGRRRPDDVQRRYYKKEDGNLFARTSDWPEQLVLRASV